MNRAVCSEPNLPGDLQAVARRASQRFKWHWDQIDIAGQVHHLAVASDPDGMLIEACVRQDAGDTGVVDPFWAATWRAAAGLDRYMERLSMKDMNVLEVGCGTGHAGLSAAYRGARVVLTDGVEDPLLLVKLSSWEVGDRCEIRRLRFGIDRLDSREFPLIIGSDVTYLRSLWPQLESTIDQHLQHGGNALLSDPYRVIGHEFREWISVRDWDYEEHKIVLDDDRDHPIRVMQLQRR